MPRPRLALALALPLAACSGSSPASAAAPDAGQMVVVGQNGIPRFVTPGAPAGQEDQVTIGAGDTVTWRFATTGYNVISGGAPDAGCVPDGVFCSPNDQNCDGGVPPQAVGSFYQHTFADGGDYPYFSQPGCLQGMTGVVHVNVPGGGTDGGADGGP